MIVPAGIVKLPPLLTTIIPFNAYTFDASKVTAVVISFSPGIGNEDNIPFNVTSSVTAGYAVVFGSKFVQFAVQSVAGSEDNAPT